MSGGAGPLRPPPPQSASFHTSDASAHAQMAQTYNYLASSSSLMQSGARLGLLSPDVSSIQGVGGGK